MKALYARYPFLSAAREAVERADVNLAALVETDGPVVERATERVRSALEEGDVGDPVRDVQTELLSYPVARVLVSVVDEHALTRRYARAEAAAAYDRFVEEVDRTTELKSASVERLSRDDLLTEFDLTEAVSPTDDGYRVTVGQYLPLAADVWGDEWRLVNRSLADGLVPVSTDELDLLLREAVHDRVAEGLPLGVPDEIADPLADRADHLREVLAELDLTREIDTVVPELFPPCMRHLLDQIQKGAHLEHHSRFAITAFLASIGMDTDDIVELYRVNSSFGEEMTRYQTDHIRGESSPTEYTPPSCATLKSYGDCVNMDDLCERISHPLAYYERKLEDSDEEELEDWRDARAEAESEAES